MGALTHNRHADPPAQVGADAKAALLRSPPQLAQHQQAAHVQAVMRLLLVGARSDGSFAPLQFEDSVSAPGAV